MNERIKELAEQAKFMAEEDINRQISYNAELKAFAEKFAELIIRECARSVTWYTKEERNWPNNGQVVRANKTVLEHFGVEE
jgi:hypothetical protein